jgi:hypothetical protein
MEEKGGYTALKIPAKVLDEFCKQDDSKCQFRLGEDVIKQKSKPGNMIKDGDEGVIVGNMYSQDDDVDLYLVLWKNFIHLGPVGTVGFKLKSKKDGV